MTELYEGWSIRAWASWQTRNHKPERNTGKWFSGYDSFHVSAWELGMPEIPLHLRYKDFTDRLDKALKN